MCKLGWPAKRYTQVWCFKPRLTKYGIGRTVTKKRFCHANVTVTHGLQWPVLERHPAHPLAQQRHRLSRWHHLYSRTSSTNFFFSHSNPILTRLTLSLIVDYLRATQAVLCQITVSKSLPQILDKYVRLFLSSTDATTTASTFTPQLW